MSKMPKMNALFATLLFAVALPGAAAAQNLDMQDTAPQASAERPTRGMTQARVEASYGAPVAKKAPVGEPPISRWEYPNMVVYFEYDRVIHAVLKR